MTRIAWPWPARVPAGAALVHLYGGRIVHRTVTPPRAAAGTDCGERVDSLAERLGPGDFITTRWCGWKPCPKCWPKGSEVPHAR